MDVEVMLFGGLRQLAGIDKEVMAVSDGTDLSGLLRHLGERYGTAFSEKIRGIRGLRILVNGREYQVLDGLETCLKDKDTVVLLPPVFGG
jgi:MoaD family protein